MSSVLPTGATVSRKWKVSHLVIRTCALPGRETGDTDTSFLKLPNSPCLDPTQAYRSSSFWTGLCIWFLFPLRQLPLSLRGKKKQIIKWILRIWMVGKFNTLPAHSPRGLPHRLPQLTTVVSAQPPPATRGPAAPGQQQQNVPSILDHTQPPPSLASPVSLTGRVFQGDKVWPCTGLSERSQAWPAVGCIFTTAASNVHSRLGSGFPCLGSLLP